MGDDLTAARRFCDSVRSDMSQLIDNVCAQPCAEDAVLIGSLDRIQSCAKQLHARAIFRAAQTVANAVNDRAALPTVQGRILSLNKLVVQYESGLDDIAPRPANGEIELLQPQQSPLVFASASPPMPDNDARFRAARAALLPLMGFTKPGAERGALARLAKFSDDDLKLEEIPHNVDIPLESLEGGQERLSLNPENNAPLRAPLVTAPTGSGRKSAKLTPAKMMVPNRRVDFEALMPSFISQTLQEARLTEKTVSVSYGADGVSVADNQIPALQILLEHIGQTLVRSVLERPEMRRSRGQSGAGHIAVTAVQNLKTLTISIECPGAPMMVSAFMPAALGLEGLKITPGANAHDQLAHIVVTMPHKAPSHSPAQVSEIAS